MIQKLRSLISLFSLLLSLSFCLLSCDTNEPPPPDNGNGNGDDKPKPKITLTVDDTSPTEVWLNLITENISLPDTLSLIRNNDTVNTIELFDSSYVIYEDSLLPSQSYTYQVSSNQRQVTSDQISAVTMDTTSHDFTWEVFEFGEHGNSVLHDVTIIDENNIWAVGAVYLKDSTGANDSKAYGIVHWDGQKWKAQKLFFNSGSILAPIRGIQIFNENDFYLSAGSIFHWDGQTSEAELVYSRLDLDDSDGTLEKIWGNSSTSIYAVGNKGSIAHYNGTSWSKIESGTDVYLRDVWGDEDGNVWGTGWEDFKPTQLLHIKNGEVTIVYSESSPIEYPHQSHLSGRLKSIWTKNFKKQFIMTTYGVYEIFRGNPQSAKLKYALNQNYYGYSQRIRGDDINDLIMAGHNSLIWHYNGKHWKQISSLENENYFITSADIQNNVAVIVGENYRSGFFSKGYIAVGNR